MSRLPPKRITIIAITLGGASLKSTLNIVGGQQLAEQLHIGTQKE
jgi:hypothetical protein